MTDAPLRIGIAGANAERGWAKDAHLAAIDAIPGLTSGRLGAHAGDCRWSGRLVRRGQSLRRFAGTGARSRCRYRRGHRKVPEHRAIVLAALAAGKHVYCEWPLGRDVAEAQEMADAARKAGIHVVIGLQGENSDRRPTGRQAGPRWRDRRPLVAAGGLANRRLGRGRAPDITPTSRTSATVRRCRRSRAGIRSRRSRRSSELCRGRRAGQHLVDTHDTCRDGRDSSIELAPTICLCSASMTAAACPRSKWSAASRTCLSSSSCAARPASCRSPAATSAVIQAGILTVEGHEISRSACAELSRHRGPIGQRRRTVDPFCRDIRTGSRTVPISSAR